MALRRGSVQDLLAHVNREVAALPGPVMREVVPVLREAERELSRDLRRWLMTVEDGAERFTAQQYRRALVQIRSALARVQQLDTDLGHALVKGGHRAGIMATHHIAAELLRFESVFEGTLSPVPFEAAAVLARGMKALIPRFRASAARYAGNVGADIRRQLAVGLVRGESFDQMTRRLIKLGGPRGIVATRGVLGEVGSRAELISEGLFRRYGHWAERIVRTETCGAYNHVAAEAIGEAAQEIPDLMLKWDAANDARTCPICAGLDGETIKVGERFPGGYEHAPAHANCRCATVAWRPRWGERIAPPPRFGRREVSEL